MDFLGIGWIWMYAGVFMMIAEILVPGFVMFFFGLGAVTTGLFVLLAPGLFQPSFAWQFALFSVFSLAYLFVLRRWVRSIFFGDVAGERPLEPEDVGRLARVTETIRPDVPGRVMLGDAEWSARADAVLEPGTDVRVTARDNLTLTVEPLVRG